jgi:hypothetical protein
MHKKQHHGKKNNDNYRDKANKKGDLLKAEDYYNEFKADPGIRIVTNANPIAKGVDVLDVSLSARGPMEDRVYSDFGFYRDNIRRGNTIANLK